MLTESPLYGVPVETIAAKCGVHPDTARRWKRTGNVPPTAVIAIRALFEHDLGAISGDWTGWSVRGDELISPEGDRFTPGMVRASAYHRQRCQEMDRGRPQRADPHLFDNILSSADD
jgi:hypothetical protein